MVSIVLIAVSNLLLDKLCCSVVKPNELNDLILCKEGCKLCYCNYFTLPYYMELTVSKLFLQQFSMK